MTLNPLHSSPVRGAWHTLDRQEALDLLAVDAERGLTREEAARRLAQVGPNRVADHDDRSPWEILLRQFRSVVVLLLLPFPECSPVP